MNAGRTPALRRGSTVASSGKDAVPATAAHKPTTMSTNGVVVRVVSSSIVQSPKGKTAGQGLDGNYGSSSQSHRQAQAQKRQKRLTDGFMIKIPNQQQGGNLARKAHAPIPAPQPRKKRMQNAVGCSTWVCHSLGTKQGKTDTSLLGKSVTEVCAGCSRQLLGNKKAPGCSRCRTMKYCSDACKSLHWARGHRTTCKPCVTWCPACGEDVDAGSAMKSPCERCQEVVYCSQTCLNNDFNNHLYRCPLVISDPISAREPQAASEVNGSRVQIPTLMQPGGVGPKRCARCILVDDEDTIARVRNERWQLSKTCQQTLEEDDKNAVK